MQIIARAYNGYKEKFGIPRQAGCVESVLTRIVFEPLFRNPDALRGIEQWSHLWLIWAFSENPQFAAETVADESSPATSLTQPLTFTPTVRPPRLGGNKRVGVFATRSPFRPNPIGLSSVRLLKVEKTAAEGTVLWVSGADLMNGTPVYDIKPYLPYTDIHPDATAGFTTEGKDFRLQVEWGKGTKKGLPSAVVRNLDEILSQDPRPAYQDDDREYALRFDDWNVHFRVKANVLQVLGVSPQIAQ